MLFVCADMNPALSIPVPFTPVQTPILKDLQMIISNSKNIEIVTSKILIGVVWKRSENIDLWKLFHYFIQKNTSLWLGVKIHDNFGTQVL